MENVSKALIMAGGVLISIMVASFMVLVLRKAGSLSAEYDEQISNNEIIKFNSQFEVYSGRENTFFDVLTVANLAYDINKKNGYDAQNGITLRIFEGNAIKYSILPAPIAKNHFFQNEDKSKTEYIYNNEGNAPSIIQKYTSMNDDNSGYKYIFKCNKIAYNKVTGKVNEIHFYVE